MVKTAAFTSSVMFAAAVTIATAGTAHAASVDKETFITGLQTAISGSIYSQPETDTVELTIVASGGEKNGTVYSVNNPDGTSIIRFNLGEEKWETRCVTKTVCYLKEGNSKFWRNVDGGSKAWSFVYNPENVLSSGLAIGATYDITGDTYTMTDPLEGTLSAVFSPGHAVVNSTGPDGSAVTILTTRAPVKVKAPPKRLIHNPIIISAK